MTDKHTAPWFTTTPEAVLRAQNILRAFHDEREADIGEILASDYADTGTRASLDTFIALVVMANRITDYAAKQLDHEHNDVLASAAQLISNHLIGKEQHNG